MNENQYIEEIESLKKINEVYEKSNKELIERNKELERQLNSGQSDLKVEVVNLRRRVLELEDQQQNAIQIDQLNAEHERIISDFKQKELELLDRVGHFEKENIDLRENLFQAQTILKEQSLNSKWDDDPRRNQNIENILNELHSVYYSGGNLDSALYNFIAIINPSFLVAQEQNQSVSRLGNIPKSQRANSRLANGSRCLSSISSKDNQNYIQAQTQIKTLTEENQKLKDENKKLKDKIKSLKKTQASAPSSAPAAPASVAPPQVQRQSPKIRELEEQVENLKKANETLQTQLKTSQNRYTKTNTKLTQIQAQIQQLQDESIDQKRKHQLEIADLTIQKSELESQVKVLKANADYRNEYEKLKIQVGVLTAENEELKKPKSTGNSAVDRLLSEFKQMMINFEQRKIDLDRYASQLEHHFEEQKMAIEEKHQREMDEKSKQIKEMKYELEEIQRVIRSNQ